ncbi:MAG: chromate efflux transporter [Thermoguttaceae bacterium]
MIGRLGELARLFLKLGAISFGGPAAYIAIIEDETVQRRNWLTREHFLDLMAATNLIPGPNAVEMAAHVGYCRAGLLGSIVAGGCFTLPTVLIATGIAFCYVHFGIAEGAQSQIEPLLHGIQAAVLAIVFAAVWRLGRRALRTWQLLLIGTGVAAAFLAGVDPITALLIGSLLGAILLSCSAPSPEKPSDNPPVKPIVGLATVSVSGSAQAATTVAAVGAAGATTATVVSLWQLGLFFLKVGAVLYGGGYVLLAYLQGDLVNDYGWLSEQQLLDAVAVGQITPGPLLSTATFVGYVLAGVPGAVVATLGILLPSFFFVAAVNPLIPRLRNSRWASRCLDAVVAASIGLMGAVAIVLTGSTLIDWPGWVIAVVAVSIGLRWKVTPAWLVLGGALAGWLLC